MTSRIMPSTRTWKWRSGAVPGGAVPAQEGLREQDGPAVSHPSDDIPSPPTSDLPLVPPDLSMAEPEHPSDALPVPPLVDVPVAMPELPSAEPEHPSDAAPLPPTSDLPLVPPDLSPAEPEHPSDALPVPPLVDLPLVQPGLPPAESEHPSDAPGEAAKAGSPADRIIPVSAFDGLSDEQSDDLVRRNSFRVLECPRCGRAVHEALVSVIGERTVTQTTSCDCPRDGLSSMPPEVEDARLERWFRSSSVPPAMRGKTIEDFDAHGNEAAVAAACSVLDEGAAPIRLVSAPGAAGKTHLAVALVRAWIRSRRARAYYLDMDLFGDYVPSFRDSHEDKAFFVSDLARMPMLVIDNLGRRTLFEVEKNELLALMSKRIGAGRPTVVFTSLSLTTRGDAESAMDRVGPALASLFSELSRTGMQPIALLPPSMRQALNRAEKPAHGGKAEKPKAGLQAEIDAALAEAATLGVVGKDGGPARRSRVKTPAPPRPRTKRKVATDDSPLPDNSTAASEGGL